MKVELFNYIKKIERKLKRKQHIDSHLIEVHLQKISFFQKERLIHLLVTIFTGISVLLTLGLLLIKPSVMIFLLLFILCTLFIHYIIYYYFLENGVQTHYKQYEKMQEQKKNILHNFFKNKHKKNL